MGTKRVAAALLLLLAGTSLVGCIAAAIPAIAGSAMAGSRVLDRGGSQAPASGPSPALTDAAPTPTPVPPTPTPAPAPSMVMAPVPQPTPPPAAMAPPLAYPDPDRPLAPEQVSFARFVRYVLASARGAASGANLPSAVLADPVALDGRRHRCAPGEQLIAVIDLDPAGGVFVPPAIPAKEPGIALGLAALRAAGVEIAWLSDLTTDQSGALRSALEQAGLDPRGQDIISLRRDGGEGKQVRRDNLAGIACIVAIAGDERPDFDERVRYLRNPEAGAALEPLIGDGWFLIAPLIGN